MRPDRLVKVSNVTTLRQIGLALQALADALSETDVNLEDARALADQAFEELNKLDLTDSV